MSWTTEYHKCPDCGANHPHKEQAACDAGRCAVVAAKLPYRIVARAPWGGDDGTDILHACSPEHAREVVAGKPADYEVEIEASTDDMRKLIGGA